MSLRIRSGIAGVRVRAAALYLRISTRDGRQDTANQRAQLRQLCHSQGWNIVAEYEDHESGGKPERRQFQAMMTAAAEKRFDVLVFWALDRLSREGALPNAQKTIEIKTDLRIAPPLEISQKEYYHANGWVRVHAKRAEPQMPPDLLPGTLHRKRGQLTALRVLRSLFGCDMLVQAMTTKTKGQIVTSDYELLARAMHAFFVAARKNGFVSDQPSNSSAVRELGGKRYVILQNTKGALAVYRVRNDGMLKRLKRWPENLLRTPRASERVRQSGKAARRVLRAT